MQRRAGTREMALIIALEPVGAQEGCSLFRADSTMQLVAATHPRLSSSAVATHRCMPR